MSNSQKAHTLHRGYLIELQQNTDQNWVVIAVTHTFTGRRLLPPGFNYPDRALAERYAKMAIDLQVAA